jgi:hypothetical protein
LKSIFLKKKKLAILVLGVYGEGKWKAASTTRVDLGRNKR